ncbi:MAG: hypothetical protein NVSMB1_25390 [Polyangiales bacterium]
MIGPLVATSGFAPNKMTGTGDGHLYGLNGSTWGEINTGTGKIKGATKDMKLPFDSFPGSAAAFYAGDLWVFEGNDKPDTGKSTVFRHDMVSGVTSKEGEIAGYITGAGVTVCAPILPK